MRGLWITPASDEALHYRIMVGEVLRPASASLHSLSYSFNEDPLCNICILPFLEGLLTIHPQSRRASPTLPHTNPLQQPHKNRPQTLDDHQPSHRIHPLFLAQPRPPLRQTTRYSSQAGRQNRHLHHHEWWAEQCASEWEEGLHPSGVCVSAELPIGT